MWACGKRRFWGHTQSAYVYYTHTQTFFGLSVNIYVNLNYTKSFLKTRSSFNPTEQLTVLCSGQGSINIFWLNEIWNDMVLWSKPFDQIELILILGALNNDNIFLWYIHLHNKNNGLGVRRSVLKRGLHYLPPLAIILSLNNLHDMEIFTAIWKDYHNSSEEQGS